MKKEAALAVGGGLTVLGLLLLSANRRRAGKPGVGSCKTDQDCAEDETCRAGRCYVTDQQGQSQGGQNSLPHLRILDLRETAPRAYVRRRRKGEEITAVVLHQTGFSGWLDSNPLWAKVRAHFVVRRDGLVVWNFDPEDRLRFGSNDANKFCVTIEHEGNYPSDKGVWWQGDKFGRDRLEDAPAQVVASRTLISDLKALYPSITHVFAHRQWDPKKPNCCGPDIWRAVGEWTKNRLGLRDGGRGWSYGDGLAIPESWRTPWAT